MFKGAGVFAFFGIVCLIDTDKHEAAAERPILLNFAADWPCTDFL